MTFVLPPLDLSGGMRVLAMHARLLRRLGHCVRIVSARPERRWRISLSSWLRPESARSGYFEGLEPIVLRHGGPVRDADVPDADVVLATWWETAEWVSALSGRKGAKAHFVQDYEDWGGPVERVDACYRLPTRKIAVSRWLAELLRARFGCGEVQVVPNAVDLEAFSAPKRGKQAAPTFGLTYSAQARKGSDVCLEAVRLARRRLPGIRLLASGVDRPASGAPLPEGTAFSYLAGDSRLGELYSRCDAWLYGARRDGFGLPILEAMACGTPVIAAPAGAAPELVAAGGGVLLGGPCPEAMAEAILAACAWTPAQWQERSTAARAAAQAYTWHDASLRLQAALSRAWA